MPIRNVPGIGSVEFPDEMSEAEIQAAINSPGMQADPAPPTAPALSAFQRFVVGSRGAEGGRTPGTGITDTLLPGVADIPSGLEALSGGEILRHVPAAVEQSAGDLIGGAIGASVESGMKAAQIARGEEPLGGGAPYTGPPSIVGRIGRTLGLSPDTIRLAETGALGVPGVGPFVALPPEALGQGLATLLPGVGESAEASGRAIGEGDVAGGLGGLFGLVGSIISPSRVKPAAKPLVKGPKVNLISPQAKALERAARELKLQRKPAVAPTAVSAVAPPGATAPPPHGAVAPLPAERAAATASSEAWPLPYDAPGAKAGESSAPAVVRRVPLTVAQRRNSAPIAAVENALEKVIFAGSVPFAKRKRLADAEIRSWGDAIVKDLSRQDIPRDQLMQTIQTRLADAEALTGAVARSAYRQVDKLAAGVRPDISAVRQKARQVLAELKEREKTGTLAPSWNARLLDDLAALSKGPDRVPFEAAHQLRSNLRELVRGEGNRLPSVSGGLEKHLAGLVDGAIQTAAREVNPDVALRLRKADAFTRTRHFDFDNKFAQDLIKTADPNRVARIVTSAAPVFITAVKKHLPVQDVQALKARVVRDFLTDALEEERMLPSGETLMAMGVPEGGVAPAPITRESTLLRSFNRIGEERWRAVLSEREFEGLKGLVYEAQRSKGGGSRAAAVAGAMMNVMLWFSAGSAAIRFDPAAAMYPATAALAIHVASRILTKPGGGQVLSRALNNFWAHPSAPSKWGGFGASRLGAMVQSAAREEARSPLGASDRGVEAEAEAEAETPAP